MTDFTTLSNDPADAEANWKKLPEAVAVAMLSSPPKFAEAWALNGTWTRHDLEGECLALIECAEGSFWATAGEDFENTDPYTTLEEAQAACDAALRKEGYLLG